MGAINVLDGRTVAVMLRCGRSELWIVGVHAPHNGRPHLERETYFHNLGGILRPLFAKVGKQKRVVVLGGFNAQLGASGIHEEGEDGAFVHDGETTAAPQR